MSCRTPHVSLLLSTCVMVSLWMCAALAAEEATRLARHEIRDPGMDNIVSHTLLVPAGWTLEGGVVWTPGLKPFVHNQFGVVSGEGREIWFLSGLLSSYVELPPATQQFMRMQGQALPPPGTPQGDGSLWQRPPRDAADYVVSQLLPQGRPGASNVRVREVERLPDFERAVWASLDPGVRAMTQSGQVDPMTGVRSEQTFTISRVSLSYRDGAQDYREDFIVSLMLTQIIAPDWSGVQGGPQVTYVWHATPFVAARAPADRYAATEALFVTIAGSLTTTPEWQTRIDALQAELARIEHQGRMASIEEFGRRQRQIAQTNQEISDMQMSSWRERQDSNARMSRSFSNATLGVDDYRNPDGTQISLPSQYRNVFTDSHGNYMMSDDPHFDPNRLDQRGGWQQIEPARR